MAAGCHSTSTGQLDRVEFSWGGDCLPDCALDHHAMASGGAQTEIGLSIPSGIHVASAQSTRPDVAQISYAAGSSTVMVTSGVAGQSDLVLRDAGGAVVDRATLTVADTARLGTTRGWTGSGPVVMAGATEVFHVTTLDAHDAILVGTGAVSFQMTAPARRAFAFAFGDSTGFTGDVGSGTVTASATKATLSLPVTFVDASAITGLSASADKWITDQNGAHIDVHVVATSAAGPVYGAGCAWTTSVPTMTAEPTNDPSIEKPAQTTTRFTLAQPDTFTATCTIGAQTTTVTLQP